MEISLQVWVTAASVVFATLVVLIVITRMYRIVGPNTALVVTGMRGMRTIIGGGTIVLPLVEQSREQYLRCALSIWGECVASDGKRPERAVSAIDVLCVLFEQ